MATHDEASSSSGSSSTYDMFLNFRGEDTRNNFTGFLHSALKREGFDAFMDSENLWGGKQIKSELFQAIQGSKISITVFSKGYADSKWCLRELVEIVRCHISNGQIVLPVFFDVLPRDVRYQTGSFEGSFRRHKGKCNAEIKDWKAALNIVAGLMGYELQQVNGNQAKLVKLVVDWALSELGHPHPLGNVINPVGVDAHADALLSLSNVGSNYVQFAGICHISEIGEIEKAFYNQISKRYRFYKCSHIVNPVMEGEIKCPFCKINFMEEMISRRDHDRGSNLGSYHASSLSAPILLGKMGDGPWCQRNREEQDDYSSQGFLEQEWDWNPFSRGEEYDDSLQGLCLPGLSAEDKNPFSRGEKDDDLLQGLCLQGLSEQESDWNSFSSGEEADDSLQRLCSPGLKEQERDWNPFSGGEKDDDSVQGLSERERDWNPFSRGEKDDDSVQGLCLQGLSEKERHWNPFSRGEGDDDSLQGLCLKSLCLQGLSDKERNRNPSSRGAESQLPSLNPAAILAVRLYMGISHQTRGKDTSRL